MELIQTYETTISNERGDQTFAFFTVPTRSAAVNNVMDCSDPLSGLEVQTRDLMLRPSLLPDAIACMMYSQKRGQDALEMFHKVLSRELIFADLAESREYTDLLGFAEQIAYSELLPFENSPLEATSLSTLLTKAGGMGIGAFAGWVVAGATPLLLIAMPAGMVICGAAAGIAHGLEEGLKMRISSWLRGEKPRVTAPVKAKATASRKLAKASR